MTSKDGIERIENWSTWHDEYENEDSELNSRKRAVQAEVAKIVEQSAPGPVTVVSICGGQGREVIGALENHARHSDVRGRIVELDVENAAFARSWAQKAELHNLEIVTGDASLARAYAGLPPADLVVISGVFGHLSSADRMRLVAFLRQIVRKDGFAVWTFFRIGGDKTGEMRAHFRENMFAEKSFETLPGKYGFTIGTHQYRGQPDPFEPHAKLFDFGSSRAGAQ